jgi:phage terminase large subunit-like protein
VTILQIGYDAYKAQEVINALSAAVAAEGGNPEKILRPVPQTYGAFTSPVETFEMAAKVVPARVQLCMNPIFPYCFGNCYLDEDRMRNKKPLKRKENLKIDAAIASLMTFWLYNNYEQ